MKPKYEATDEAEVQVSAHEDLRKGLQHKETYACPPTHCDFCKTPFLGKRFMIDGNTQRGGVMWACMCASCFLRHGEGLGWGKGQLYTQLDNGKWLMTAGFSPPR